MLWVFILPIAIKSVHFHDQIFICKALTEKNFHEQHKKCLICDYEFSVFSNNFKDNQIQKDIFIDCYYNNYVSVFVPKQYLNSVSLRAPPLNIHI
jgi:hypothetical protein